MKILILLVSLQRNDDTAGNNLKYQNDYANALHKDDYLK